MKRILSIWFIATLFVIAGNMLAAVLEARGVISSGNPSSLIDAYQTKARSKEDQLWLLGNSLLAAAVVDDDLSGQLAQSLQTFPLGSATFHAQVLLAESLLAAANDPPSRIVFFVSKDDCNRNGDRAVASHAYIKAIEGLNWTDRLAETSPVSRCRTNILRKLERTLYENFKSLLRPPKSQVKKEAPDNQESEAGPVNVSSTYLANQGRDFSLDLSGLQKLKKLANEYPDVQFVILFAPVSDAVIKWQQDNYPVQNVAAIVSKFREETSSRGITVIDCSSDVTSDSAHFRDAYHLTAYGRSVFTPILVDKLDDSALAENQ